MDKKKIKGLIAIGAALSAAAAAAAVVSTKKKYGKSENKTQSKLTQKNNIYFTGGGLASLAGAVYLIRDCKYPGECIHIFEKRPVLGGSNDGSGTCISGFSSGGIRLINEENYANFMELMESVPSLENPDLSTADEIINFINANTNYSRISIVSKNGDISDTVSTGFDRYDRKQLIKLLNTSEEKIYGLSIEDWFMPHFFKTEFWYAWSAVFRFKPQDSLAEFRRHIDIMISEFLKTETLSGMSFTPYNQYESIIEPLREYLAAHNVNFETGAEVTDIDFEDDTITATAIHINDNGTRKTIYLNSGDLCIVTAGSVTDNARQGDFATPAGSAGEHYEYRSLWHKLAEKKNGLGNPAAFFSNETNTAVESFTITAGNDYLLKKIKEIAAARPVNGKLLTFTDSNWKMSIALPPQPHFKSQDENTTVIYGYGLTPEKAGNYIGKPMKECCGAEILYELICHLHMQNNWDEIAESIVNVIPLYMPYATAPFLPSNRPDRPQIIPKDSVNFAMIGLFTEIPDDTTCTEEHSVKSARIAVYTLTNTHKKICPIAQYSKKPFILLRAWKKTYR